MTMLPTASVSHDDVVPEPRIDRERVGRAFQSIAVQELDIPDRLILGLVSFLAGRPDEATEVLGRLIGFDPGVPDYHAYRDAFLLGLRRVDEAICDYGRALSLRPDFVAAQQGIGLALAAQAQFQEAEAHRCETLRPNPNPEPTLADLTTTRDPIGKAEGLSRRPTAPVS